MPGAGVEPARCFHRGILSPLRLPISPSGPRMPCCQMRFEANNEISDISVQSNKIGLSLYRYYGG